MYGLNGYGNSQSITGIFPNNSRKIIVRLFDVGCNVELGILLSLRDRWFRSEELLLKMFCNWSKNTAIENIPKTNEANVIRPMCTLKANRMKQQQKKMDNNKIEYSYFEILTFESEYRVVL